MTYKPRYMPQAVYKNRPKGMHGRKPCEENWSSDERIIERDIYYGFLKHRAQAKFRKEEHTLTIEQWRELWTHDKWLKRGQKKDCLCLIQITHGLGWHVDNVDIVERNKNISRKKI